MLYAFFCYNREAETGAWTKEHDAKVMADLGAVQDKLAKQNRLGPVARLMPTTTATSVRKSAEQSLITDGPFVETKEQLLGFYIIECATLDDALATANDLSKANPGAGGYEIRPVAIFHPGAAGHAT